MTASIPPQPASSPGTRIVRPTLPAGPDYWPTQRHPGRATARSSTEEPAVPSA